MVDARLARDGAGVAGRDEADEEPAGIAAPAVAVFPAQPVECSRLFCDSLTEVKFLI